MTKFEKLGREIIRHKYLYYIKMENEISDYTYDMLEREYLKLALKIKREPKIHVLRHWQHLYEKDFMFGDDVFLTGFPHTHPWAKELLKQENDNSFDD